MIGDLRGEIAELREEIAKIKRAPKPPAAPPPPATLAGLPRDAWVTQKQAAVMLGCSSTTVERLRKEGVLRTARWARRIYIDRASVLAEVYRRDTGQKGGREVQAPQEQFEAIEPAAEGRGG
jgi:hypothetical protein